MKTQTKVDRFENGTICKCIHVTGALVGSKFAIRASSKFPYTADLNDEHTLSTKTLHIRNALCNSNRSNSGCLEVRKQCFRI